MFKKGFFGVCICIAGIIGIMVLCNKNPAAPKQVDITGVWTGMDTIRNPGSGAPDTFTAVLTITGSGYSLLRGHVFYGSSGSMVDSSREVGTWAKTTAGDSVILTPHMVPTDSTQDSCFYFDAANQVWRQCDGSLAALFKTCQPPIHIKINITGNAWQNVVIPRYDDFTSVSYNLTKQ